MEGSPTKLFAFGMNEGGQLGLGDFKSRRVPTLVTNASHVQVQSVSCGGWNTMLLTGDHEVYTCGDGNGGKTGKSHKHNSCFALLHIHAHMRTYPHLHQHHQQHHHHHPTTTTHTGHAAFTHEMLSQFRRVDHVRQGKVSNQEGLISSIHQGRDFSAVVSEYGSLYTWGVGDEGRLAHQNNNVTKTPKKVSGVSLSLSLISFSSLVQRITHTHTHLSYLLLLRLLFRCRRCASWSWKCSRWPPASRTV
jgi:RCC1 and BTB domain-containing protein